MLFFYLIAALTDGPYKFLVGLTLLAPFALAILLVSAWVARRWPGIVARLRPFAWWAIGFSLLFAMLMNFLQPMRTAQEIMIAHRYDADRAAEHAEIERSLSQSSERGMAMRGLIHFGPLAFCVASLLGMVVGTGIRKSKAQKP